MLLTTNHKPLGALNMEKKFNYNAYWSTQDGYHFNIGNLHLWEIRDGYQTARLVENRYQDHKRFNHLEEALTRLRVD